MNAYSKVCQLDRYVVFLGFPADVIGGGGSGVGIETSEWTETGVPKSLDEVVAGKLRIDFGKNEGDILMRSLLGNWMIDVASFSLNYEGLEEVTMCP